MKNRLGASFRDPSGFMFTLDGVLYRQVNQLYEADYHLLMDSGLYAKLTKAGLLVPHTEVDVTPAEPELSFQVIRPERVPFIAYPYEWSFSQLKDAALATLSIQKRALKAGMTLKDASAYNIQFVDGKPMLIDTLSFEKYEEGVPWTAYRQFCQHFLAPLVLMAKSDVRLSQLLRVYIDGVPLDLASKLLPIGTRLDFGLLTHIHLHAQAQKRSSEKPSALTSTTSGVSKQGLIGLIDSLRSTVKKLEWKPTGTVWGNYYEITNYSDAAFDHKKQMVLSWTEKAKPSVLWDLGANNGEFSRVAMEQSNFVVSFDIDPAAVEQNYRQMKTASEKQLLPLVLDLTNPSPALGWDNNERESFGQRAPVDMVLALALIHHLVIGNNVPLQQVAEFFSRTGKWLAIEFVPKQDSQVQVMLSSRKDIFTDYYREKFEEVFAEYFEIVESVAVAESERTMYLMRSKAQ